MANMTNSSGGMLKSVIALSVLVLGAAVFFVGSEDSEGLLATAANSSAEEAESAPAGPKRIVKGESSRGSAEKSADNADDSEVVEWSDEAFIDSTEGFDPTPSEDGGFSAAPTDSTINESDGGGEQREVDEAAFVDSGNPEPVPGDVIRREN